MPLNISMTPVAALLAAGFIAGCARTEPESEPSTALAVEVWSDTSRTVPLRIDPPRAPRVWLESVAIARPLGVEAPLPGAEPASPPPDTTQPPALPVDPSLKPPILIEPGRIVLPVSRGAGAGAVELDVRVSEEGEVTDARWAGGIADPSLVAAAVACARGMRFRPALLGGRPVSVWCRQRFDFPAR